MVNNNLFQKSIVVITSQNPNNDRFGTGFFVHRSETVSFLISCAHVVVEVGGASEIMIGDKAGKIVAMGAEDELDLAVLEVEGFQNVPLLKLGVCGWKGSDFVTAGFHKFGQFQSIRKLEGKLGEQVGLESRQIDERIMAWDLEITSVPYLQNGFSGSPIIDKEREYVIGVASYKQGNGRKGLAISIEEVNRIWRSMPSNLIKRWPDREKHSDLASALFEQANQLWLMGKLREAVQLYQRVKQLNSSFPQIDEKLREIEKELEKDYVDSSGQITLNNLTKAFRRIRIFASLKKKSQSESNEKVFGRIKRARLYLLFLVAIPLICALLQKIFD